jgi:hypothetical protein
LIPLKRSEDPEIVQVYDDVMHQIENTEVMNADSFQSEAQSIKTIRQDEDFQMQPLNKIFGDTSQYFK